MKTIDAVFMDEQNSINVKISLEDKSIRYKKQFGEINVIDYPNNHDRFIIDRKECFHVGTSINHAGSKLFAISKLESPEHINFILNRMLKKRLNFASVLR